MHAAVHNEHMGYSTNMNFIITATLKEPEDGMMRDSNKNKNRDRVTTQLPGTLASQPSGLEFRFQSPGSTLVSPKCLYPMSEDTGVRTAGVYQPPAQLRYEFQV